MRFVQKLPDANELIKENPLTAEEKSRREELLSSLRAILSGKDGRKILCIGPCSADREDAVLEYAYRLASLREKVKDVFLIIPRIYTSKPRSTGTGYKGMLHRPAITGKDDILAGVTAVRSLHLKVIRESLSCVKGTKMFTFSAQTKDGRDELWAYIESLLTEPEAEPEEA